MGAWTESRAKGVTLTPPLLDLNGDYTVSAADTAMLMAAWRTPAHDLNGDGTTDSTDLAILLSAWGASRETGWVHVHHKQFGVEASFNTTLIEEINRDMLLYDGEWVEHGYLRATDWIYRLRKMGWVGDIYIDDPFGYVEECELVTYMELEQAPIPGVGWVVRIGEQG